MKDLILTSFLAFLTLNASAAQPLKTSMAEINFTSQKAMRHSDQLIISFTKSIEAQHSIDSSTGVCTLSLPNVSYASAVAQNLAKALKNASRNITLVTLTKLINEETQQEGSQLKITFSNKNIHLNIQELEHPHQLIIDVISNELLQQNLTGSGVIAHAFNGVLHAHYAAQTLV